MNSLDKSINSKFDELKRAIREDKGRWPSSQGVNALLVVYPPQEEQQYLQRAKNDYSSEYIIDLSQLFIKLIDSYGLETFKQMYRDFRSTPEQVFNDPQSPEPDLFGMIIDEIKQAQKKEKMPILIRTGIFYGTGIRNNNLLESSELSQLKKPLIIFYPGEIKEDLNEKERIYFLGTIKASDYRGQFI